MEGSNPEFLFLLVGLVPVLMMFHQIINVKYISVLAWVPGAGMPCWCLGSSSCPCSEMQLSKGCVGWPVPLVQREGPEAEGLTSSGRAAYVSRLAGECRRWVPSARRAATPLPISQQKSPSHGLCLCFLEVRFCRS